jgi:hypothetical protein
MLATRFARPMIFSICGGVLALACAVAALQPEPTANSGTRSAEAADGGLALTVYNHGSALVRDRRAFQLLRGFNEISFTDVAATIDPTSVLFKALNVRGEVTVLEQNYAYDLVGAAALLEKYLDESIVIVTKDGTRYEGELLSGRGDIILRDRNDQVMVIRVDQIQEFAFPELPEGLITRPTLVWQLLANQAGEQDVEITYLAGGLAWQADYVLLLAADGRSLDLDGWVTLANTSGATFRDARLKLIAGDLQRLPEPGYAARDLLLEAEAMPTSAPIEQREFFEYHLYEVPRPVTVKDNETKQIEFIRADGVPAEKFFVYDGLQCRANPWYCSSYGYIQTDPSYGVASNPRVMVMVEIDTETIKADLPRGRVRLYQEDIDGAALLVGEDLIDHTPQGEHLRLYVGDAFDVVGERVQVDFRRPSEKRLEETFEITLRNHKDEAVEVRVIEHLFRWSEWRMLRASHTYEELDASTIEFSVRVPANGESSVTYTVQYWWP